jgi:hypothetical protein
MKETNENKDKMNIIISGCGDDNGLKDYVDLRRSLPLDIVNYFLDGENTNQSSESKD